MKIGIDIRNLLKENYSGVPEYTFQLVKQLLAKEPGNQYVLFYNSYKNLDRFLPAFMAGNLRMRPTHWPNKFFNLALTFFNRPRFDKLAGGTDIFYFPDINFCSWSKNTKAILTVHDLSPEIYPEFFTGKHHLWWKLINPKKKLQKADHIIAVSQQTKRDLVEIYKLDEQKISVVLEGIGPEFKIVDKNDPRLKQLRDKLKLPEKFLLYLGTIEPRKNSISIIEALDAVNHDIPLVIAGKKGWKCKEIFEAAKKSTKKIMFLDYVESQDKPLLYNLAEAFVWPTWYEGFGLPPLEAQACGLPVITSNVSCMPETFGDSAILVSPDRVEELAWAINELLADQQLRDKLVSLGLKNASQYSWEKTARETLEVFNKVYNSPRQ